MCSTDGCPADWQELPILGQVPVRPSRTARLGRNRIPIGPDRDMASSIPDGSSGGLCHGYRRSKSNHPPGAPMSPPRTGARPWRRPYPPARFRVAGRAAAVLRHHRVRRTDGHVHGEQDHRLTDQAGLFLRRPRCQPLLRPLAAPRPAHRRRRPPAAADRPDAPVPPPLGRHRPHLRRGRRRLAQQYHRAGVRRWAQTIGDRRPPCGHTDTVAAILFELTETGLLSSVPAPGGWTPD